ncbi:MAG: hypothetical protein AB7T74_10055 [Clostridia bacterium]|jgi:mRNA-degrading endonuclease toxin of MazEF toxin-antitoxin module
MSLGRLVGVDLDMQGLQDGMQADCAVILDTIHTVQKGKLSAFITILASEKMGKVKMTIHFVLGMDEGRLF